MKASRPPIEAFRETTRPRSESIAGLERRILDDLARDRQPVRPKVSVARAGLVAAGAALVAAALVFAWGPDSPPAADRDHAPAAEVAKTPSPEPTPIAVPPAPEPPSERRPLRLASEVHVSGGLDPKQARRTIGTLAEALERCASDDPEEKAFDVVVVVDPRGRAIAVETDARGRSAKAIVACIESKVRTLEFPRETGVTAARGSPPASVATVRFRIER